MKRILFFFLCSLFTSVQQLHAQTGTLYTTSGDRTYSLTKTTVAGEESTALNGAIVLLPEEENQTIDGFGFAMTYSACYNLLHMEKEARTELLKKTFSMTEGYGSSYVRISIGCSDFSSTEYSLCDVKGPDDDLLKNFRLHNDETQYVIPVLKEILEINPNIKILGSPWTCPRWMKCKSSTDRSAHNSWTDGHLNPTYYQAYADYFVKFVEAFRAEGINIYAVTPQNEPLNPGNCASLVMLWNEEASFVQRLAPAFANAGLNTKIYLFDHNYNYDNKEGQEQYPAKIYKVYEDKNFAGKDLIVGAAYHNYGGSVNELNNIHEMYPDKELIFSEASIGTWNNGRNLDSSLADHMTNVGIELALRHIRAITMWNFMLDMNRGPNLDGGCQTCFGAVDIANDYKSYTFNSHYYSMCHFSAVVRPGAVRINTKGWWYNGVSYAAFRNPDGTLALVLYNSTQKELNIKVTDGNVRYPLHVPVRSAVSLLMNNGTSSIAAPHCDGGCCGGHECYNLQGMRVDSIPQHSIYIQDGKKKIEK